MQQQGRTAWRRVWAWWAAVGLLVMSLPALAAAAAPEAWQRYAQEAGQVLAARLVQDDAAGSVRLREWLQGQTSTAAGLRVSLWIDADGRITDSRFDSLGDARADADLHALLSAAALPSPPPDMRQPLRLGLSLQPEPAAAP